MPHSPFSHPWGRRLLACVLGLWMWPGSAFAGMTVYSLSDIVAARLDVISFFGVLVLLLAWVFKKCWNAVAADVTWVPALTYKSALGAIVVAALFCGLILTMISGARELMTPGAWDKVGTAYRLSGPQHEPEVWMNAARRSDLEQLRDALWNHAHLHSGRLPANRESTDFPASVWKAQDPETTAFVYLPRFGEPEGSFGFEVSKEGALLKTMKGIVPAYVLAFEPAAYGATRFALLSDGTVVKLKTSDLDARVQRETSEYLTRRHNTNPAPPP